MPISVLKSIRRLSWHLISDAQELFDGLIAEKGADAELDAGFMKVGSFVIRTPEDEDEEAGHKSRVPQTEPLIWEKTADFLHWTTGLTREKDRRK